jgi:micrococcal nuclease
VIDGDTFITHANERIRILGIDTPEIGRKGQASQPFAVKAKQALNHLLRRPGQKIFIQSDSKKNDRFGRTLAYVFLQNGENVSEYLLHRGFAHLFILPPNTRYANCFSETESKAMANRVGIWKHADYALKTSVSSLKHQRVNRFSGVVSSISRYRKGFRFTLNSSLVVTIDFKNLVYFPAEMLKMIQPGQK